MFQFNLKKLILALVVLIAAIITIPSLVEDVDNKEVVINQVPFTGTLQYWTTAGTKWQGLGKTTSYEKTSQIWFDQATQDKEGNITLGRANAALPITYNDKGKGVILGSVRVELPLEEKYLQRIQTHYASMDRLVNDLVKPTLSKVITACGPLMSSLESVSEKRTDLIYYITDQLNDGVYRTKVLETKKLNVATGEDELMRIAEPIIDSLSPGGIKRQEASPFSYYGLRVSQLSISDMLYEKATNDQIAKQREADMSIVTAKAKAAEAAQLAIRNEEEGKAAAMEAKWIQEKEKAVAVTRAEQEYEVARLAALKAKEDAKKIEAQGYAEAAANRAKVQAGLTPQEAAEWQYKTTVGVAEALANSKVQWVPDIMYTGGGNSASTSMDAVGLKMLMDISKSLNK